MPPLQLVIVIPTPPHPTCFNFHCYDSWRQFLWTLPVNFREGKFMSGCSADTMQARKLCSLQGVHEAKGEQGCWHSQSFRSQVAASWTHFTKFTCQSSSSQTSHQFSQLLTCAQERFLYIPSDSEQSTVQVVIGCVKKTSELQRLKWWSYNSRLFGGSWR